MKSLFYMCLGICAYFDIKKRTIPIGVVCITYAISFIHLILHFNLFSILLGSSIVIMGLLVKNGIGKADIHLLVATVLMFEPKVTVNSILYACFAAIIFGLILIIAKKSTLSIPFIPFLWLGLLIVQLKLLI